MMPAGASSRNPISRPVMTAPRETRSLWPRVWRSLVSTAWHKAAVVAPYARCWPPNRGASPGQQPMATRMSPELSSTTRNVPSARMARPWASLMPATRVVTIPDDRVTALIVPPPMSAT
jgi:hypothetical protein